MIKYLYIDDEKITDTNKTIESYIEKLSNDNLTIEYKHIDEVNAENFFMRNLSSYNGVLLDLRTDEFSETSNFTGSVWGQHIRDLVTNKKVDIDLPIVLFSTDKKLRETYFKDMTSNNIFDRFLTKDNIPGNAIQKLISLANGYKEILKTKSFEDLLKIDISSLDERIFSRFHGSTVDIPVHEYAQMILKDLIYSKGVLINEKYLASRLGVDKETSTDWDKLKGKFEEARYIGVFSDGWDRWWMHEIDDIFEKKSGTYLSYLDAKERVSILKEKFELTGLINPELIERNTSYDYWVVCKALKKPLDPMEGFRIYSTTEPKAWQEYEYVSLLALLTKNPMLEEKDIKVHPLDKEKYDNILKEIS